MNTPQPKHRPSGLTAREVVENRRLYGSNVVTPPKDRSVWRLFIEKFDDPIIRILLLAGLLSLAIAFVDGRFTETVGILAAVVLATCVGFLFEWDALRRFKRLNRVNDDVPVKVMRGGTICEIPRREVVVADRVYVESGDTVPADGVLCEAVSLRVNESTLTGEPETGKSADPERNDPEATYPSNVLLRGTTVMDGYGVMTVTAVGDRTEAGCVTEQSAIESGEPTPLNRQLTRLSRQIGKAGIALSAVIFILLLAKAFLFEGVAGTGWLALLREVLACFMVSVAMIVMAVPEGLPMSITLSLAMSMRRMLKTNNLVRRMHACETMGAVTVICTDKTGTLTRNRMTVQEAFTTAGTDEALLARAVASNSTAFLDSEDCPVGNPTEGALLEWLSRRGYDYAALRGETAVLDRITFSSQRKYMATLCQTASGRRIVAVKGAPEIVRTFCAPDNDEERMRELFVGFQSRAMRTLAVAYAETGAATCEEAMTEGGLHFAAVVAISDPVRDEVPAAVTRCLQAGIAVKIVTGDTAVTATEIARKIGLWDDAADGERNRMTGAEFAAATDEELLERVAGLKILSRARPLDKQRLVRLLQQRGEVVAVTGDGTNDAPALNFADVGLSMGSGTSVAREASDITLLDDSFSSIVTAVLWGRSLYRNIQRFVLFQLTVNFAAIVIVLVGSLLDSELPLTVVQILWVNLIMDTFAAMAMASLPPDPGVMNDKPRSRDESILSPAMRRTILACGGCFVIVLLSMLGWWHHTDGVLTLEHLTLFFTAFVFLQFWNLFNAKGFETHRSVFRDLRGCRTFFFVLLLIGAGQVAIVEWGGEVFRTCPLPPARWACVAGLTSLIAIGGDLVRTLRRRRQA